MSGAPRASRAPRARAHRPARAISKKATEAIIKSILRGAPPETAAMVAGIPRRTHQDWLRKGRVENPEEPYRSYALAVDLAVERWHADRVGVIQAAESKDARSAQWLLERRLPDTYGQRTRLEGRVEVQPIPMFDPSKLSLEKLRLLRDLLEEARPDAAELGEERRAAAELLPGEPTP